MEKRPTSITIIAWFLLVSAVISAFTSLSSLNNPMVKELMAKNPLPIPLQYAMLVTGLAVMIASGIGMLKGLGWARLLYVIWGAIGTLIGFATSPIKTALIPGVVFFAVVIFFLYRPASNRYFTKT
jgi:hypothetical protein